MLISIITINFNNIGGLKKTINSVLAQIDKPHEFIIIDGGSVDGSVDLIKRNENSLSYWVSEPDGGIFNAHNKGISAASGDYLLFLNSGDTLYNQHILSAVKLLLDKDILYGDLQIIEESKKWIKKYNSEIRLSYFLIDTLPHQGAFIKKSLFDRVGKYDESMKFAADWKFFMDAICLFGATIRYLDFVVADYDYSGASSNIANENSMLLEKRRVFLESYPMFYEDYDQLMLLRGKYQLLSNSRIVKIYFRLRKLFVKSTLEI